MLRSKRSGSGIYIILCPEGRNCVVMSSHDLAITRAHCASTVTKRGKLICLRPPGRCSPLLSGASLQSALSTALDVEGINAHFGHLSKIVS